MSKLKEYVKVYTFKTELPGSGETITFTPYKIKHFKNLLSREDNIGELEKALDDILKDCVQTEGFNPEEIYLKDKFYLLLQMRKYSKGSTYQFFHKCEECGTKNLVLINLDSLKVTKINKNKESSIILSDDTKLDLSQIKRKNEKLAFERVKNETNNAIKIADAGSILYASVIDSFIFPDGNIVNDATIDEKVEFVKNMLQIDFEKLTDYFKENAFGIEFNYDCKCIHCSHEEKGDIPIDNFFF